MNIFVLHTDPEKAATMMCDKHVIKMVLETAQMLCTIAHGMGYDGAPYRSTHKNHPCTVWAAKTSSNWSWLLRHGFALCDEYTKRYGKNHKSIMWETNPLSQHGKHKHQTGGEHNEKSIADRQPKYVH